MQDDRVSELEETVAAMENKLNQILDTVAKLVPALSAMPETPPLAVHTHLATSQNPNTSSKFGDPSLPHLQNLMENGRRV